MQTQNDAKTNDAFLCIFMRNTSSQLTVVFFQHASTSTLNGAKKIKMPHL